MKVDQLVMKDLANTYGKTWVFWQSDRGDNLPIGTPELMMVATKDGEWNKTIFENRDTKLNTNWHQVVENHKDLTYHQKHPNSDSV